MTQPLDQNPTLSTVPGGQGYQSAYLTWTDDAGQTYWFYPDLVISEQWEQNATVTEHPVEQGANVVDHVRVELEKCTLTIFATNEPIGGNSWDTPTMQAVSVQGQEVPGSGDLPSSITAKTWEAQLALKGALLAAGGVAGSLVGGAVGGPAGGAIGNAVGAVAGAVAGALVQGHEVDVTVPIYPSYSPESGVTGQVQVQQFANPQDYVQLTIDLFTRLKSAAQLLTLSGSKQTVDSMVIEEFSYTRSAGEGTGATITLGLKEIRFVQTQVTTVPAMAFPGASGHVKRGTQNPSDATAAQQQQVLSILAKTYEVAPEYVAKMAAQALSLFGK